MTSLSTQNSAVRKPGKTNVENKFLLYYIRIMKTSDFTWNENKNQDNIDKHGVSFVDAQYAFQDNNRIILEDFRHSDIEKRYFCLGKIHGEIMTVRFTYRIIKSEFLVLPTGGKEKRFMKKKIQYTDEPADVDLDHAKRIKDYLPLPGDLVFKKERVVTLRLDEATIGELKKVAGEKGLGVSTLIRMWVREHLGNLQTHS